METALRKWGNSVALRVPASVMEAAGAHLDQPVDIRAEDGRIIIEPIRTSDDLSALIAAISDGNRHHLVETGPAVGNEVW